MVEPHKDPMWVWLEGRTLSKVHCRRVLIQLVILGITPISLPRHATLDDLYAVSCHCISDVQAVCNLLQAAMASRSEAQYKSLLEQLDITFKDFSLPQQSSSKDNQLLEKHLLVFATSPEDYGFTEAIDHPIPSGNTPPIQERYYHIPPALC